MIFARRLPSPRNILLLNGAAVAALFSLATAEPARADTVQQLLTKSFLGGLHCHPSSQTSDTSMCCGSPGAPPCASALSACEPRESLVAAGADPECDSTNLDSWCAQHCALPVGQCGGDIQAALRGGSNTFYVTSDLHFFRDGFQLTDQITHVAKMNQFSSQNLRWGGFFGIWNDPANKTDDPIVAPRAVLSAGDLVVSCLPQELGAAQLLYENWTPESLQYPFFLGLGNHDYCGHNHRAVERYLQKRMNCGGVAQNFHGIDGSTSDYSWEFDNVHFIQLNYFGGFGRDGAIFAPTAAALTFLQQDLQNNVGASGRPVVIIQHAPFEAINYDDAIDSPAEHATAYETFVGAISGYNVIAIFAGHVHNGTLLVEHPDTVFAPDGGVTTIATDYQTRTDPRPLDNIVTSMGGGSDEKDPVPTEGHGNFAVARISDQYFDVGHVFWRTNASGYYTDYTQDKRNDGKSAEYSWAHKFFPGASGCRKRINDRIIPLNALSVTQGSSASSWTMRLPQQVLPSPTAVRVQATYQGAVVALINRSFVDSCANTVNANDPSPSSQYVLTVPPAAPASTTPAAPLPWNLAAAAAAKAAAARASPSKVVPKSSAQMAPMLTLTFASPVDTVNAELVELTPLKMVTNSKTGVSTSGDKASIDLTDDGSPQVPIVLTGPPGKSFGITSSITEVSSSSVPTPHDWPQVNSPRNFDSNGYAQISVGANFAELAAFKGMGLNGTLSVQTDTAQDSYTLSLIAHVSSTRTIAGGLTLTASGSGTATVLQATLNPQVIAFESANGGTYRPSGTVYLYPGNQGTVDCKHPPAALATNYVNDSRDNGAPCQNNIVYFNGSGQQCQATAPGGGAFQLKLPSGSASFVAQYCGDGNYQPAQSAPITVTASGAPPPPPAPVGKPLTAGNGMCLDIDYGGYQSNTDGAKIQQWSCSGAVNQNWRWNGTALMAANGKCLDMDRAGYDSRTNGAKIQLWGCNGGPNQIWRKNGSQIVSGNGKCLDNDRGDYDRKTAGGHIQAWDCTPDAPNQKWSGAAP